MRRAYTFFNIFPIKRTLFHFLFFSLWIFSFASYATEQPNPLHEQDEIVILQDLMEISKKNLKEQKDLLEKMMSYRTVREKFLNEPDHPKYATLLVKAAVEVDKIICKGNWTFLFSKNFLEEVSFYASIGKEHGIY